MASSSSSSRGITPTECEKGPKHLIDNEPDLKTLPPTYVLTLPKSPLLVSHASIPIIDLSALDGPVGRRISSIQAISSACAEWGFFRARYLQTLQIINHGIEASLLEQMLNVVKWFFDLPWEEKMKYASEDVMNPIRYGTSLNTSKKHALHWRDYLRHYGHPIGNNFHLWPSNPPAYRNVAKEYLEEVWKLAMKIAGAISEGLGLDCKYIEESLGEGCQIVASNCYPPCPEPDRTLGLAAHSDHGGLTILMQNDVVGLQVKHKQSWVAVESVPGTFVVNIGDYLEILSNGRYKSVEHRAVVNAERMRISVAVGHGPELTAKLGPASPLIEKKSETRYRPIVYKDYIRIQQSSSIRGKSPLESVMIKCEAESASPVHM